MRPRLCSGCWSPTGEVGDGRSGGRVPGGKESRRPLIVRPEAPFKVNGQQPEAAEPQPASYSPATHRLRTGLFPHSTYHPHPLWFLFSRPAFRVTPSRVTDTLYLIQHSYPRRPPQRSFRSLPNILPCQTRLSPRILRLSEPLPIF